MLFANWSPRSSSPIIIGVQSTEANDHTKKAVLPSFAVEEHGTQIMYKSKHSETHLSVLEHMGRSADAHIAALSMIYKDGSW